MAWNFGFSFLGRKAPKPVELAVSERMTAMPEDPQAYIRRILRSKNAAQEALRAVLAWREFDGNPESLRPIIAKCKDALRIGEEP